MSRPWMPLYVADYLGDTRRLKTIEHGAYMLLIMEYWQHGGLPDNDEELAEITGLDIDEWIAMRSKIARLFQDGWRHKRIDAELAKAADISERRKASAERRWCKGNANALQEQSKSNANGDANDMHRARVPQPQPHTPSLRSGEPRAQRASAADGEQAAKAFERFWQIWPNKTGKPVAIKSFFKVWREADAICAGVHRYIADKPPDRQWLNPSTFLNQRRWEDSPAPVANARAGPPSSANKISAITEAIMMMESHDGQANTGFDHPAIQQLPSLVDHEPGGFGEQNSLVLRDDEWMQSG